MRVRRSQSFLREAGRGGNYCTYGHVSNFSWLLVNTWTFVAQNMFQKDQLQRTTWETGCSVNHYKPLSLFAASDAQAMRPLPLEEKLGNIEVSPLQHLVQYFFSCSSTSRTEILYKEEGDWERLSERAEKRTKSRGEQTLKCNTRKAVTRTARFECTTKDR